MGHCGGGTLARATAVREKVARWGCLLVLFALISARLALIIMWIFSDDLSLAYDSWIVPFIGFFLLPWTTFAYAGLWATGSRGRETTSSGSW